MEVYEFLGFCTSKWYHFGHKKELSDSLGEDYFTGAHRLLIAPYPSRSGSYDLFKSISPQVFDCGLSAAMNMKLVVNGAQMDA
jgi:hypothetical protein